MMKNLANLSYRFYILGCLFLVPLFGVAQDKLAALKSQRDSFLANFGNPGHFVLRGSVTNFEGDFFEFGMTTYRENIAKAVPLKSDGTFEERFEVANTQDIYLYLPGSSTIILSVCENDTITLFWDQNVLSESFRITSNDAIRQDQLQLQWEIHQKHRIPWTGLEQELYESQDSYTPEKKYERINTVYNDVLQTILAHADDGKADLDRILLATYYNCNNLLIRYHLYPTYRLRATVDTVGDYTVFKKDRHFRWHYEDQFIHIPEYRDFYEYLMREGHQYYGSIDANGSLRQTNAVRELFDRVRASQGSTIMQDWLIAKEVCRYLEQTPFSNVEETYNLFLEECRTPYFKSQTEQFHASIQQLYPGKEAPPFTLKDETGKAVSLADFKGKVVYIDFWGVYCGPCIQDIQHSVPKVHAHYKDQDVVFINICVDVDESQWKAALKKYDLKGVNLIAEGWTRHPVCQAYHVNAIPNYLLVNRDGTIANNNPPRPGQLVSRLGNNEIDKALAR